MKTTNKLLRTALFSAVAGMALTSAANAGSISITQFPDGVTYPPAPQDPITIACEGHQLVTTPGTNYDLDQGVLSPLGNTTGARILYYTGAGITGNLSGVIFTLTNGLFQAGTDYCYLAAIESEHSQDINDDGDQDDLVIVAQTQNSIGAPTDSIKLIFNDNGGNVSQTAPLYLICHFDAEPNVSDQDDIGLVGAQSYIDSYAPVLQVTSPDCSSNVTIEADGEDIFNNPVGSLDAAPNTIIDWETQFSLSIHPTLQLIDEYWPSNGTKFVDDMMGDILSSDSEVDLTAADGRIDIDNDSDRTIEDPVHLNGCATFEVSLYDESGTYACSDGDPNSYLPLDFDNDRMFLDGNGIPTIPGATHFSFNQGSACTLSLTVADDASTICSCCGTPDIVVPIGGHWEDDVYMGVDGVNRMNFVRWDLDESLTLHIDGYDVTHSLSSNDLPEGFFKKWEPNGTTLWAPQIIGSNDTKVVISHNNPSKITTAPWSAPDTHQIIEVRAKVWDADEEWCDNILVGTFTDQGRLTLTGKQILNAAKAKCPSVNINTVFSALFTVGAPERDIEATIVQTNPKGLRTFPIYQSQWRADDLRMLPDSVDHHRE